MHKLASIALATLLICSTAHATESADSRNATLTEIDARFDEFARKNHSPGLIYGIVRNGRLAHVHAFGVQDVASGKPVTADTVFRIASLTKSFTALAALQLAADGRLDLHAPLTRHVPGLKLIAPRGSISRTLQTRQLLNHSAGFVTDDPWADRQLDLPESAFSAMLSGGIPLARQPDEAFEYSNLGYALLGRVISKTSGQRYQDYITDVLIRPLGMTATVWEPGEIPPERRAVGYSWIEDHLEEQPVLADGAFGAAAGLSTSATDYARFVAWLLSAWDGSSAPRMRTLDAGIVREAGTGSVLSQVGQRADGPDGKPCPVGWMYGAGFYVVSDCELGSMLRHPGGLPGYGSQVLLHPGAGVGIFAFANLTYAHLSEPVVAAAVLLSRAGFLESARPSPGAALSEAADAVLALYRQGDVHAARSQLAPNLLLDRSAERRNAELRRLRDRTGTCSSVAPAETLHAQAGRFDLSCERAKLRATILLSPTSPPKIQMLELELQPAPGS